MLVTGVNCGFGFVEFDILHFLWVKEGVIQINFVHKFLKYYFDFRMFRNFP